MTVSYGLILLCCGLVADISLVRGLNNSADQPTEAEETWQTVPFYAWNSAKRGYNDSLMCSIDTANLDNPLLCQEVRDYCLEYFQGNGVRFELDTDTWRVYVPSKHRFYPLQGDCSEVHNGTLFEFGQYRKDVTDVNVTVWIIKQRNSGDFHEVSTCQIRNTFVGQKCWQIMKYCNIEPYKPRRIDRYSNETKGRDGGFVILGDKESCRGVYTGHVVFTHVKMNEKITVKFCPLRQRCQSLGQISYGGASTPRAILNAFSGLQSSPDTWRVYMTVPSKNMFSVPCPLDSLFRVRDSKKISYEMEFVEVGPHATAEIDIPLY